MLDYGELAKNPYHNNRNQVLDAEAFPESDEANYFNNYEDYLKYVQGQTGDPSVFSQIGQGLSGLGNLYADYYSLQGPSSQALQDSINPLEESYANFRNMAEQYRDPSSDLNVKARTDIRSQNLEAMTDLSRRAANEAMGTVDDSMATKGINQNVMSTAIANALENYNKASGDRMRMAADYDTKAGLAANTLSTARQQKLAAEQIMRERKGKALGDWTGNLFDFFSGAGK